mmetsp:Transcript_28088/g.55264  ORF Transcript_28088/g.55264 Transcript_28088/m.55264 type:complete len:235 (+) Transcript_28088:174-878(+)
MWSKVTAQQVLQFLLVQVMGLLHLLDNGGDQDRRLIAVFRSDELLHLWKLDLAELFHNGNRRGTDSSINIIPQRDQHANEVCSQLRFVNQHDHHSNQINHFGFVPTKRCLSVEKGIKLHDLFLSDFGETIRNITFAVGDNFGQQHHSFFDQLPHTSVCVLEHTNEEIAHGLCLLYVELSDKHLKQVGDVDQDAELQLRKHRQCVRVRLHLDLQVLHVPHHAFFEVQFCQSLGAH